MVRKTAPGKTPTSVNIDREMWRKFKTKCAETGRTASSQVERMIRAWISTKPSTNKQRT